MSANSVKYPNPKPWTVKEFSEARRRLHLPGEDIEKIPNPTKPPWRPKKKMIMSSLGCLSIDLGLSHAPIFTEKWEQARPSPDAILQCGIFHTALKTPLLGLSKRTTRRVDIATRFGRRMDGCCASKIWLNGPSKRIFGEVNLSTDGNLDLIQHHGVMFWKYFDLRESRQAEKAGRKIRNDIIVDSVRSRQSVNKLL